MHMCLADDYELRIGVRATYCIESPKSLVGLFNDLCVLWLLHRTEPFSKAELAHGVKVEQHELLRNIEGFGHPITRQLRGIQAIQELVQKLQEAAFVDGHHAIRKRS
jgi:hypothetical protein